MSLVHAYESAGAGSRESASLWVGGENLGTSKHLYCDATLIGSPQNQQINAPFLKMPSGCSNDQTRVMVGRLLVTCLVASEERRHAAGERIRGTSNLASETSDDRKRWEESRIITVVGGGENN